MTDLRTAAQQALEALEICAVRQEHQWHGLQQVQIVKAALRAALEQPEQEAIIESKIKVDKPEQATCKESLQVQQPEQAEPVAWMVYTQDGKSVCVTDNPADFIEWRSFPLYTHPPRREWRGLKEWEINDGLDQLPTEDVCSWSFRKGVYFAEAALKERNV